MKLFLKSLHLAVLTLSVSLVLVSCATNPVTKKEEFVLMSEKQEIELGKQYAPMFTKQYGGPYMDRKLQRYVNGIGQNLAANAERPELFYNFTVLDHSMVNAFALPGGYVFVTRGLLATVNSETELAAVLGHEIGHVTARHAVRQYTKQQAYSVLSTAAQILVPGMGLFQQLADILATGVIMGFGRENEMQADRLSVKYLTRSQYNPNGMASFLGSLKIAEEGKERGATFEGFFSTHPETLERINAAEKLAEKTGYREKITREADMREKYFERIQGLPYGESATQGFFLANRFFHPSMKFKVAFPKEWFYKNEPVRVIAKNKSEVEKEVDGRKVKEKATLFCQLTSTQLLKKTPVETFAKDIFKQMNINPEWEQSEQVNGKPAYVAVYTPAKKKIPRQKNITAFIINGPDVFLLTGYASDKTFDRSLPIFENFYKSFQIMTEEEVDKIKPPYISIVTVKPGDSFETLAEEYYHDKSGAKMISKINGMKTDAKLPPYSKIKVIKID